MPAIARPSATNNNNGSSFYARGTTNTAASVRRKRAKSTSGCSLSMAIIYTIVCGMFLYVLVVVSFTRSMAPPNHAADGVHDVDVHLHENNYPRGGAAPPKTVDDSKRDPNYTPHMYARGEWADQTGSHKTGKEWGRGVKPQLLRTGAVDQNSFEKAHGPDPVEETIADRPVLTAYLEPIDRDTWKTQPLPTRTSTSQDLTPRRYPKLNSCSRLPEQWPVDEYPEDDPFLPWIHDVFPTHDGKHIQFIAQNKRRCRTGTTAEDTKLLAHTEPQVALFQHVAVQRVASNNNANPKDRSAPRYRLTDHEHADEDGMETRFICRFQPSGEETLSVYNFNYEWASFRKRIGQMFHPEGRDNKQIHTSQLTFMCPVPPSLVETVRTGSSVQNDYATLFVDLVPIRTPPRYGPPAAFFPPYYKDFQAKGTDAFNALVEWGENHILPLVEDSGRWENIPICKPSLLTYGKQNDDSQAMAQPPPPQQQQQQVSSTMEALPVKQHHLASCLWASTGYTTRGNRFAINDGQRRLVEWITYQKLIGVDHFYLYDNSGAFSNDPSNSLHPIAELFPGDVTIIDWPAQVCNNNPNNVDSVGERSSQYAAEASCRLRFGPHVNWIAQFDIDEYLVPMGNNTSILPLLEKLDQEGNKIVSFGSWRAWPRRRFIETPIPLHGIEHCGRNQDCFQLQIPMNYTMLQAYNCDRQKPGEKTKQMPAEKQIYRPDYVKHHFIHYSTVTGMSVMNKADVLKSGHRWIPGSAFPDPLSRFGDEQTEALMLHSKAVATQDTVLWEKACKAEYDGQMSCRLGTPFPEDMTGVNLTHGDEGWKFNCYVNHKIDDYWVPLLEQNLKAHIPELASRLEAETDMQ